MENVITLSNVSKSYKGKTVIDNVSYEFEKSKCYGIIGHNGSGKSVLMKLIAGFAYPDKGEVRINGRLLKKDMDFIPDAGVIINSPEFINSMSGYNNLKYLAEINKKASDEKILETLEWLGLKDAMKKRVSTYSVGMKQRLRLAQAIMDDPDTLILDEPMNGLDKDGVGEIREYLLALKKQGKTILLASHSAEDIDVLCDTVCEMDKGKLEKVR